MNYKIVIHLVSFLLMMLAAVMGIVAGVSYFMHDPSEVWQGLLRSGIITVAAGFVMYYFTRVEIELSRREGIGIVVFGWLFAVIFGCLPFLLCGALPHAIDAFFESCSGLTTTGASVMNDLENQSRGILLWRACTHLLGGMGILVLVVAIIPYLGVGGMQIYRAEVTGPSKDRLTPRIASTAKLLWGVYILLNIILILLLKLGGMDWFDSTCHAFATISTGGFSTRSASIAAYQSTYIESVIIVFMFISGINFALHFRALKGDVVCYFKDSECRFYLGYWLLAVLLVAFNLLTHHSMELREALRHSAFYVTSLMTTTGFTTVDYDAWPALSKVVLLTLFVLGGCAGSTAGGLKQIRASLLIKKMGRTIQSFLKPQAIYTVKHSGQIIAPEIILNVAVFFFIYMGLLAGGSVAMSFYTPDVASAVSSTFSAMGNIGPGLSVVGPLKNFADLPAMAKFILSVLMLVGRLELFTFLVIFLPSFWRK